MREYFLSVATSGDEGIVRQPAWAVLKEAVETIRVWQSKDGSIDFAAEGAPTRSDVANRLERLIGAVRELAPLLPHDAAYHEDFTSGYDSNSAVLFPETVAVREVPERFSWGAIFCDREAARFRRVTEAAVTAVGLALPERAADLVAAQALAQQTFVLWDMIHDRTHSHGDLPFDPFMIKQRQPFWMYGLEELRCDLTAFKEAVRLEADGYEQGSLVQYAVLFDRLFRFPVTGERVRNYDGMGGQLLFAYLHKHDVLPDEFPLSMFYEALAKKLRDVIASTKGITADDAVRAAA